MLVSDPCADNHYLDLDGGSLEIYFHLLCAEDSSPFEYCAADAGLPDAQANDNGSDAEHLLVSADLLVARPLEQAVEHSETALIGSESQNSELAPASQLKLDAQARSRKPSPLHNVA